MTKYIESAAGAARAVRPTRSIVAIASALLLAIALAVAPAKAWAAGTWISDINGNPIAAGSTIDVNVLQQGIIVHKDPQYDGWGFDFYSSSGRVWMSFGEATMESIVLIPASSLVPGETYTLSYSYCNLVNGNVPSEYLGSGSVTFTVSGGQDQGAEEEPEAPEQPTVPGGADEGAGASDGGAPADDGSAPTDEGGSSGATDDASTDTSEESQQQSQQSDPSPSHSTVSDGASPSQATQGASRQGSPSSEGADYATSEGSDEAGGSGIDEETMRAGQSGGAPQVSGTALAGMGSLYSLGGTGGAAMSGDESGDAVSALDMVITGLPYLWVVVVAVFLLALPSGLVGRLAAGSRSAKGRSRLA